MEPLTQTQLIAPCGLNCSVCRAFLRERNRCPGCRADEADKPVTRVICRLKSCKKSRSGNHRFCLQCGEPPCEDLLRLDKRYRTRYNTSPIENLVAVKKGGIKRFLQDERKRWACSACCGKVCMHTSCCATCGKKAKPVHLLK